MILPQYGLGSCGRGSRAPALAPKPGGTATYRCCSISAQITFIGTFCHYLQSLEATPTVWTSLVNSLGCVTQGSNTSPGLHLYSSRMDGGRGRDRSQGHHRGCSSAERIGQQGPGSITHCLLSHAQTSAATSHRDILSSRLLVSWTDRFLAGPANRHRLFSTRVPGPAEPSAPAGDYSIQCLLHSEGHSQPHIPSTSALHEDARF